MKRLNHMGRPQVRGHAMSECIASVVPIALAAMATKEVGGKPRLANFSEAAATQ